MTCEEVRESLEAFISGDLRDYEAAAMIDHLSLCPGCQVEYEEMSELIVDLRRLRYAVRPLREFDLSEVRVRPRPSPLRRYRLAVAAVLAAWLALATVVVLVPSFASKIPITPVGRELHAAREQAASTGVTPPSALSDRQLSLSRVPSLAVAEVSAALSSATSVASHWKIAPNNSGGSLEELGLHDVQIRLVSLGPALEVTDDLVRIIATVDLVSRSGEQTMTRSAKWVVTAARGPVGDWFVRDIEALP